MTFKKKIESHKTVFQVFFLILMVAVFAISSLLILKTILDLISFNIDYDFLYIGFQVFIDIGFFIAIIAALKFWKLKLKGPLKIPTAKTLFYILLFTICAFSYDVLLGSYFYNHVIEGKLPIISFTIPNSSSVYVYIKLFVFAPIYEEMFYRIIIFTKLKKRYSLVQSMFISSFFFAFGHLDFSIHLLSFFVLGLILSYVYHKTNSILTIVLLHSFYNILNKSQKFIEVEFTPENYVYLLYYIIGFIGVYYSFKKLTFFSKKSNYFYLQDTKVYRCFVKYNS